MGEIKSVKVDNWGVFFLQKLQNFFNKTDYCDLTLQFRDNSQLKVHRLVLSACTDYFNVLEQTCEMVDDALIMPNELQADVVVPIVNFMYTGTLEFELKMYGRLLRTAKEMNMTVLLKLLEAHRRTMEGVNKAQRPPSPKTIRRRGPPPAAGSATAQQVQQQRRILTANNVSPQRRGGMQVSTSVTGQKVITYRQQIGSTAVTRTTTIKQEAHASEEGSQTTTGTSTTTPSSPFEQLRKGYNNTKRPASTSFVSPPAKKPNIEDVKEFAEQQRMRKQIAAEYGEDPEFESMLDDDIHDDNDDDEDASGATEQNASTARSVGTTSTIHTSTTITTAGQRPKSQQQQQEQATITIKQGVGDQPATIIVKDASNSKMNHAKIISEVLRQYPHLVKGNKNIKLKIMPNSSMSAQKVLIKKDDSSPNSSAEALTETETVQRIIQKQQPELTIKKVPAATTATTTTTSTATTTKSANQIQEKKAQVATATPTAAAATATGATAPAAGQKRRIDSKTMHALIALGAENTTGPWLCLRCGVNGRPISIPSYRGFRRHLINTHKEKIDAALCEHCGWRSSNKRELHFHVEQEHKIKSTLFTFPDCLLCSVSFLDSNALSQHMQESHANEEKQQCIYCNKIFAKELQLYQHMRSYHKKQAIQDGIIDYEDEEYLEEVLTQKDKEAEKVKILSDISLPVKMEQQPSSEAIESLSTIASGIAASLGINNNEGAEEYIQAIQTDTATGGVETKFINADGNEMVLTEEQRKEIMSQLNQDNVGGTVMVLQDDDAAAVAALQQQQDDADHDEHDDEAGKSSQDESHETEEDEYDDSQIYNELATEQRQQQEQQQQQQNILEEKLLEKQNVDENTTDGGLEWAENLLSAHDNMEEEAEAAAAKPKETVRASTPSTKRDDISLKLKELTGDWTDEEEDEDMEAEGNDPQEHEIEGESSQQSAHVQELEEHNSAEDHNDDVEMTKADREEEEEDENECEQKSTTVEEDDIDLALKNLHTDSPVPQQNVEEADANSNFDKKEEEHESTDIKKEVDTPNISLELEEELENAEKDENTDNVKSDTKSEEAVKEVRVRKDTEEAKTENDHDMEVGDENDKTGNILLDELMAEVDVHHEAEKVRENQDQQQHDNDDVDDDDDDDDNEFIQIKKQITPTKEKELTETDGKISTLDVEKKLQAIVASANAVDDVDKKDEKPLEHNKAEKTIKSLISEWAEDDDDEDDDDVEVPHEKLEKTTKFSAQRSLEEMLKEATTASEKSASTVSKKEEKVDI